MSVCVLCAWNFGANEAVLVWAETCYSSCRSRKDVIRLSDSSCVNLKVSVTVVCESVNHVYSVPNIFFDV
mgnify:CR=1 FL=1|jgi:hypothetical protein